MTNVQQEILRQFALPAEPVSCERYGHGHINETYLVVTRTGERFILHKINDQIFRDVDGLMENIHKVLSFLQQRVEDNGPRPQINGI